MCQLSGEARCIPGGGSSAESRTEQSRAEKQINKRKEQSARRRGAGRRRRTRTRRGASSRSSRSTAPPRRPSSVVDRGKQMCTGRPALPWIRDSLYPHDQHITTRTTNSRPNEIYRQSIPLEEHVQTGTLTMAVMVNITVQSPCNTLDKNIPPYKNKDKSHSGPSRKDNCPTRIQSTKQHTLLLARIIVNPPPPIVKHTHVVLSRQIWTTPKQANTQGKAASRAPRGRYINRLSITMEPHILK